MRSETLSVFRNRVNGIFYYAATRIGAIKRAGNIRGSMTRVRANRSRRTTEPMKRTHQGLVNRHCIHVIPSVAPSYCNHVPLCSSGHSIFFRFILFILIPTIRGSIYDGRPRRRRRHRVVLVLAVPFRCVCFCSSCSWLIPRRRPENRYYYTGCAPYVLCVTPINIEETALRPYPERRASLSIGSRMARMYLECFRCNPPTCDKNNK